MSNHLDEFEEKMAEYNEESDRRMHFVVVCLVSVLTVIVNSIIYWMWG